MTDDLGAPEPTALEREINRDIAEGENPKHPLRVWLSGLRARVDQNSHLNLAYRIFIALIGAVIILAGIIMLVTPGPGWLTIFLGLAVLSTEFHWARRLSHYTKVQLAKFWAWWLALRERRKWRRARRVATRRMRRATRP